MSSMAAHNLMTREDFLHRVLHSGEVTRIAQHLALVIFILSHGKSIFSASMRDLERITGWGKSTIRDHLTELEVFMKVTLGVGRGKTTFELQGVIEDAINSGLVSGTRTQEVDTTTNIASATVQQPDDTPDTTNIVQHQDANPDSNPDTNFSVRFLDANPDAKVEEASRAHARIETPSGLLKPRNGNQINMLIPLGEQDQQPKPKRAKPRPKPTMDQFDRFWSVYPNKSGKKRALDRFMALSPEDAEKAIAGAKRYADECAADGREKAYIKWPQGWLSERRYLDYDEPRSDEPEPVEGKRWGWWRGMEDKLRDLPIERWRAAFLKAKPNGTWPWWQLTAPPGHEECLMPQELQDEYKLVETFKGQITHD